jgi:hypothetical protein
MGGKGKRSEAGKKILSAAALRKKRGQSNQFLNWKTMII